MSAVIKLVRFHAKPRADAPAFAALNERFQYEAVPLIPGLVRREATQGADGEQLLVMRFADVDSAKAGPPADLGSDVAGALMSNEPSSRALPETPMSRAGGHTRQSSAHRFAGARRGTRPPRSPPGTSTPSASPWTEAVRSA